MTGRTRNLEHDTAGTLTICPCLRRGTLPRISLHFKRVNHSLSPSVGGPFRQAVVVAPTLAHQSQFSEAPFLY